ncbi:MAG: hypothetical protein DRP01_10785 [Archaeoglobales archaeon]|nr:MAG: hypothetical protein DRP09_10620 [Candidatus Thorarchaeota archaeon]RLI81567.1 MAG: hypothetical protein DRP01_10785 [Archaeoglobales archaeon]
MNPTNIEAPVTLSRVASDTIPFARAVQRSGDGKVSLFGGTVIDDCQAAWTAGHANVTITTPAGTFASVMNHIACAAVPDTTNIAYKTIASTDMSDDAAFGILIKSSVALSEGDVQVGTDETAAFASPQLVDLPAMEAGKWYYFNLEFGGVVGDRDAVIGFGLYNNSGGALTTNLDVQWVGRGGIAYDIAGFAYADQTVEDDQAVEYQDVEILANGRISFIPLSDGETCLAEQRLYPIPGTGKLTTTEIVFGVRPITAAEDQPTAGGDVMVVR